MQKTDYTYLVGYFLFIAMFGYFAIRGFLSERYIIMSVCLFFLGFLLSIPFLSKIRIKLQEKCTNSILRH